MKAYEGIFIVNPALNDKDADDIFSGIMELIKKGSGNIVNSEKMGKRKLAYKIKKCREGNYYRIEFDSKTSLVAELKKALYLNINIIRFIIIAKEEVTA